MTKLSDFNLSELGIFIGVCSSALVAVVLASQKSKCSKIGCCGCVIERDIDAVVSSDRLEKTGHTGQTPRLSLDHTSEPAQENP
jgi:hypothetical protein